MPLQRQGNSLRIIHRTVQIFSPAHMAPQDPIPSFLEEPSFGPGFFVSCHSIFILVHATKASLVQFFVIAMEEWGLHLRYTYIYKLHYIM